MQDKIFDLLLQKDEITWQTLLYETIKKEQIDPWDIDVSLLSKKYIERLKSLSGLDFRISGKVVLAAAILLKIKSTRLVGEDITELDRLMAADEESFEEFYDELSAYPEGQVNPGGEMPLIPRMPQPRKRKVSIYDLMSALDKALEVRNRRVLRNIPAVKMQVPQRKMDISKLIKEAYDRIQGMLSQDRKRLTFSELLPSESKEDKVLTFIPLLHLSHVDHRKIDLLQGQPFGDIEIVLYRKEAEKAAGRNI